jgi:hypothetical protein
MDEIEKSPVFREIVALVEQQLTTNANNQPSRKDALVAERKLLSDNIRGWAQSLGRPDLPDTIRRNLEEEWQVASDRIAELDRMVTDDELLQQSAEHLVDPEDVKARLKRLHEALQGDNATVANLQLALHIDRIECNGDGLVSMRTCKLGIVPDAVDLIRSTLPSLHKTDGADEIGPLVRARRRCRPALGEYDDGSMELEDSVHFATDPHRFAGLPENCFWVDTFTVPERVTWPEANAEKVFDRWQQGKIPRYKLAIEFGVSVPTIRQAIRLAQKRRSEAA